MTHKQSVTHDMSAESVKSRTLGWTSDFPEITETSSAPSDEMNFSHLFPHLGSIRETQTIYTSRIARP